ncbi:unnamed protein product, partial [Mesorhabditis spiculigera]
MMAIPSTTAPTTPKSTTADCSTPSTKFLRRRHSMGTYFPETADLMKMAPMDGTVQQKLRRAQHRRSLTVVELAPLLVAQRYALAKKAPRRSLRELAAAIVDGVDGDMDLQKTPSPVISKVSNGGAVEKNYYIPNFAENASFCPPCKARPFHDGPSPAIHPNHSSKPDALNGLEMVVIFILFFVE